MSKFLVEEKRGEDSAKPSESAEYSEGVDGTAYPISTLRAPNGVTSIGGAKAYAAKFATAGLYFIPAPKKSKSNIPSPITTEEDAASIWIIQMEAGSHTR